MRQQDIAGGVKPEEFDAFHELILHDELGRVASGGAIGALFGGLSIGLPPILNFGSKYLQDKVRVILEMGLDHLHCCRSVKSV